MLLCGPCFNTNMSFDPSNLKFVSGGPMILRIFFNTFVTLSKRPDMKFNNFKKSFLRQGSTWGGRAPCTWGGTVNTGTVNAAGFTRKNPTPKKSWKSYHIYLGLVAFFSKFKSIELVIWYRDELRGWEVYTLYVFWVLLGGWLSIFF